MKSLEHVFAGVFAFVLQLSVSYSIPSPYNASETASYSSKELKTHTKSPTRKCTASSEPPQYMLDLYNQVSDSRGLTKSPLPHGASLVRAVPVQVMDERRFSFPIEKIPAEESILEAEVHIHHHQLGAAHRRIMGNQTLYQFTLLAEGSDGIQHLVVSYPIGRHFSGWRMSSVGEVIKKARETGEKLIFFARSSTMDETPLITKVYHGHHCANHPLLILFNQASNKTELRLDPRNLSRRDLFDFHSRRVKRTTQEDEEPPSEPMPTGCMLQSLHVDFDKIGWGWVVFPKSYDARQCVGLCSFPLSQDLNPTNHATVVSIVHYTSSESERVQRPLCVPSDYKTLALLYYDVEETVILKKFDRMVATQCGCR